MQHSRQTVSPTTTAPGPSTAGPAPAVAENSVQQAKIAAWLDRAHAALEGAEWDAYVESDTGDFQFVPPPQIDDGGPVDESLRLLGPEELAELGLDELVAYLDEVVGHFTAAAAEQAGLAPDHRCDPDFVEPAEPDLRESDVGLDLAREPSGEELDEELDDEAYRSQTDNAKQGGKTGETQCSATALTMSLVKLAGGEAELAAELPLVAGRLVGGVGECAPDGTSSDAVGELSLGQLEEQVIELMLQIDWERATSESPKQFGEEAGWRTDHFAGANVIKHPYAQSYLAHQFSFCGGDTLEMASKTGGVGFDERWAKVLQAHEEGAEITFQADFTGSGHVVHIVEMDEQGMTVHDPYGLCLSEGWYLKNGTARTNQNRELVDRRCAGDSARMASFDSGEAREDWGRANVYTRAELEGMDALPWALILRGA
jgi:hypothetical protein